MELDLPLLEGEGVRLVELMTSGAASAVEVAPLLEVGDLDGGPALPDALGVDAGGLREPAAARNDCARQGEGNEARQHHRWIPINHRNQTLPNWSPTTASSPKLSSLA